MLGFLWITLTANSQKFVSFLTQASHASQNEWKTRRLCEEAFAGIFFAGIFLAGSLLRGAKKRPKNPSSAKNLDA